MKEMSIKIKGDKFASKKTFNLIKSLENALELNHKLPDWISQMSGMSGRKYRYLVNDLIQNTEDARYLEIGSWLGSTACSAAFGNKLKITCVDNWAEFNGPKDEFLKNIDKIKNENIVFNFIEKDFRKVNYRNIGKYNIYLFDGPHTEVDQYDGVIIAQPCLDDNYIIIVDDWNWGRVRAGSLSALNEVADIMLSIDIRTTHDDTTAVPPTHEKSDWHNGVYLAVCKKKPKIIIEGSSSIPKYWVNQQLQHWSNRKLAKDDYNNFVGSICNEYNTIYSLDINNTNITSQEVSHISKGHSVRFSLYFEYLKTLIKKFNFTESIKIPICIGDTPPNKNFEYPLFSFDKLGGSEKILIPDIDYLTSDRYRTILREDTNSYDQKNTIAKFAGSTTGVAEVSTDKSIDKILPRVRSAVFFKGSPLVSFKITEICQINDQKTIDYIANNGILSEKISWESQLKDKFLISIDGNGSTWSRVVKALCSNSVLLKYDSPRMQFYYDSLVPWLHYIPISSDHEIEKIVQSEIDNPGKYEYIAEASSKFARSYLNKEVIDFYVIELLRSFSKLFK
jgi:hypothetical protein